MGVAIGIKFTAVLAAPAVMLEILMVARAKSGGAWLKAACLNTLKWGCAAAIVFAVIGLIWGRGSSQVSWRAHFTGGYVPGLGRPQDFVFPTQLLFDHAEVTLAVLVAISLLLSRRRRKDFVFPLALLLTAIVVHVVYRPWWMYYYLHFAIPMAWLAGFAVSESMFVASRFLAQARFRFGASSTWKGVTLCGLVALALTRSLGRLEGGVKDIRQRETVSASQLVAKMKEYAYRTHWVYSDNAIYPFHARLPMPPELAVVTPKRFWSGQITVEIIVQTCKQRQVEQLVLDTSKTGQAWKEWLNAGNLIAYQHRDYVLYVAKEER